MHSYRLDSIRILIITSFISTSALLAYTLQAGSMTWWHLVTPLPVILALVVHRIFLGETCVMTSDTVARQGFFFDERISLKNQEVNLRCFAGKAGIPAVLQLFTGDQQVSLKLEGPPENWEVWHPLRQRLQYYNHIDLDRIWQPPTSNSASCQLELAWEQQLHNATQTGDLQPLIAATRNAGTHDQVAYYAECFLWSYASASKSYMGKLITVRSLTRKKSYNYATLGPVVKICHLLESLYQYEIPFETRLTSAFEAFELARHRRCAPNYPCRHRSIAIPRRLHPESGTVHLDCRRVSKCRWHP